MNKVLLGIVLIAFTAAKCNSSESATVDPEERKTVDLIEMNKRKVASELALINRFIEKKKWKMESSGTGLRYMIYEKGDSLSPKAKNGQYATINFSVRLLNGKLCYESEKGKPETFLIGRDHVESGLHEGILYMRIGEKARFILPPHLAHGLIGDRNNIPGDASIWYDVELVKLR